MSPARSPSCQRRTSLYFQKHENRFLYQKLLKTIFRHDKIDYSLYLFLTDKN